MATLTTPTYGFRYPDGDEPVSDGHNAFLRLATDVEDRVEVETARITTVEGKNRSGTLALRPLATAVAVGTFYFATDTGDLFQSTGSAWRTVRLDGDVTIRVPWTWHFPGEVKVPAGDSDHSGWQFVNMPTAQTLVWGPWRTRLRSGTSVTFGWERLGTDGIISTVTSGYVAGNSAFGDEFGAAGYGALLSRQGFRPVISAVSGTPRDLTITLFVDVTV